MGLVVMWIEIGVVVRLQIELFLIVVRIVVVCGSWCGLRTVGWGMPINCLIDGIG